MVCLAGANIPTEKFTMFLFPNPIVRSLGLIHLLNQNLPHRDRRQEPLLLHHSTVQL